ncbi:MAG: hypothetical protein E6I52_04865 [Chloroflexi bacterium]|nr:MAG: hypothetical protein E6I52_04865 [Chloroflexota bacterium]
MPAQPAERRQNAMSQAAGLVLDARLAAKADELTIDVRGQGAGQLERVALSPAEQARLAKRGRGDVDDAHRTTLRPA